MLKNKKMFCYQMQQEIAAMVKILGFVIFFLFVYTMLEQNSKTFSMEIVPLLAFTMVTLPPNGEGLGQQMNFCFCRRTCYKQQVMFSLLRSLWIAFLYASFECWSYQASVSDYAQDTGKVATIFHQVSWMELFLSNLFIFFLFYLIQLSNVSQMFSIILNKKGETLQLKLRTQMAKKKYKGGYTVLNILVKVISFILFIGYIVGIQLYYRMQLQVTLSTRMIMMGSLILLCGVTYLYGKHRFQPRYI